MAKNTSEYDANDLTCASGFGATGFTLATAFGAAAVPGLITLATIVPGITGLFTGDRFAKAMKKAIPIWPDFVPESSKA